MIPLKLKLTNFYSYRESEIDFTKLSPVMLIVGEIEGNKRKSNGVGKCLSGDTVIYDWSGQPYKLKDIVEERKELEVISFDRYGKLQKSKIVGWYDNGIQDVFKVTTQTGKTIKATSNHPFRKFGYVEELKNLKIGDRIAVPRSYEKIGYKCNQYSQKINKAEAALLGLMLSEGLVNYRRKTTNISFTNSDREIISLMNSLLSDYNLELVNYTKDGKNFFGRCKKNNDRSFRYLFKCWAEDHLLLDRISLTKEIPPLLFNSSKNIIAIFLGAFLSGDGSVYESRNDYSKYNKKSKLNVSFSSSSFKLIQGLQYLLLRLGLQYDLVIKDSQYNGKKLNRKMYELNSNSISIFKHTYKKIRQHVIGSKRLLFDTLYQKACSRESRDYVDSIPCHRVILEELRQYRKLNKKDINIIKEKGLGLQTKSGVYSRSKVLRFAERLRSNRLQEITESDICWERINNIEYIGKERVYDIKIDSESHFFVANNIFVHNSSIFDAITFALFGECRVTGTRNASLDDLICYGEDESIVEFNFIEDGSEYNIVRSRSRTRRSTRVDFNVWTGSKWRSVGDRKKDTQKEILKKIGVDYVIFSNSVLFKQGEVSQFAQMTSGERREVVKKLLEVDNLQACSECAKKKYEEIVKVTDVDQNVLDDNSDIDIKIKEVDEQLKNVNIRIGLDEKNKTISNNKIAKFQDELIKNKEQVALKHRLEEDRTTLKEKIKETESILQELRKDKETYQNRVDESTENCSQLTEQFNELVKQTPARDTLKQRMDQAKQEYDRTEKELNKARDAKTTVESDLKKIKRSVESIRELGEGKCPTCFADVTNQSKSDVEKHLKEEFSIYKPKYEEATNIFNQWANRLKEVNNEIEQIKEEANEYNRIVQEKKLLKEKIQNQTNIGVQNKVNLEKTEEAISKNEEQLERDSSQLKSKEKQYDDLKNIDISLHQQIQTEIGTEQDTIEQLNESISRLNIQKGSLFEQQKDLKERKKEIERIKIKLQNVQEKKQVFLELSKSFGKNGIQALILENSTVEIERIANDLLNDFTDGSTSIAINTLRKNKNKEDSYQEVFDIEIRDGSRIGPFETYSGGEKFRVAFAIRIALSMLLMRRSGVQVPFLLYDEAFSDLDDDGIAKLVDIFFILKKRFDLQLVITHTTQLKDKFSNVLLVQKDTKGSRIIY